MSSALPRCAARAAAFVASKLARTACRRAGSSTTTKRQGSLRPTDGARQAVAISRSTAPSGSGSVRKARTSRRHRNRSMRPSRTAGSKNGGCRGMAEPGRMSASPAFPAAAQMRGSKAVAGSLESDASRTAEVAAKSRAKPARVACARRLASVTISAGAAWQPTQINGVAENNSRVLNAHYILKYSEATLDVQCREN